MFLEPLEEECSPVTQGDQSQEESLSAQPVTVEETQTSEFTVENTKTEPTDEREETVNLKENVIEFPQADSGIQYS